MRCPLAVSMLSCTMRPCSTSSSLFPYTTLFRSYDPQRQPPLRRTSRSVAKRQCATNPLTRFFEQFAADQPAADFGCAGADVIKFRVAQKAPGRKIVDVAVTAQALDRLERHPHTFFRG